MKEKKSIMGGRGKREMVMEKFGKMHAVPKILVQRKDSLLLH
jgi:hypothetical protein